MGNFSNEGAARSAKPGGASAGNERASAAL